jgi:thiosulfate/3-mercaptopyruvate sulfurtransferase
MDCMDCHTGDEMHGMGITAGGRYDGPQSPSCESCHEDIMNPDSENEYHTEHSPNSLACQVCHSQSYMNCVNCHVEQTDDGVAFFRVEEYFLGFYIGRNSERTEERPYHYVPVRHVPVDPESFSFYGADLLPNYDDRPTWVYTTPHNIQRNTPQTQSCRSCHQRDALFLTEDVVAPEELDANRGVIVDHDDVVLD